MTEPRPFFTALHDLLEGEGSVPLGEFVDKAGEQTFGLMVLLLALPSLIPGVNVVGAPAGGFAIAGLGWQMAKGNTHPWIPERLQQRPLHKGQIKAALARVERIFSRFRLHRLERRPLSKRWMGVLVAWTGLLLALPVPLPFGNILPALALCLQGTALLEERPLLGWLGALGGLAITVYFGLSFKLIVREIRKILFWFARRFASLGA